MYLRGIENTQETPKPSYSALWIVAFVGAAVFAAWPLIFGDRKRKQKKVKRGLTIIML